MSVALGGAAADLLFTEGPPAGGLGCQKVGVAAIWGCARFVPVPGSDRSSSRVGVSVGLDCVFDPNLNVPDVAGRQERLGVARSAHRLRRVFAVGDQHRSLGFLYPRPHGHAKFHSRDVFAAAGGKDIAGVPTGLAVCRFVPPPAAAEQTGNKRGCEVVRMVSPSHRCGGSRNTPALDRLRAWQKQLQRRRQRPLRKRLPLMPS